MLWPQEILTKTAQDAFEYFIKYLQLAIHITIMSVIIFASVLQMGDSLQNLIPSAVKDLTLSLVKSQPLHH